MGETFFIVSLNLMNARGRERGACIIFNKKILNDKQIVDNAVHGEHVELFSLQTFSLTTVHRQTHRLCVHVDPLSGCLQVTMAVR